MARAVTVFHNADQVLLLPDGQRRPPEWPRLYLRYRADFAVIELLAPDQTLPDGWRLVAEIRNTRMLVPLIQAREIYCGWINDAGAIAQRRVECDLRGLLP